MGKNRDQVRIFYEQIWNLYDKGVIPKLLDKAFTFRGSLGETRRGGAEGFTEYLDQIHTALGEYHCKPEEMVSEEDRVFAKMCFSGVHRAFYWDLNRQGSESVGRVQHCSPFRMGRERIYGYWEV